ncbi:uncharacterized protein LOC141632485 [Silene latifolia]|uniref:uncharacterized protein LOC141632485 n=1 Tax=Silene latifolia TaxID=37657 RepID=UPI003D787CA0
MTIEEEIVKARSKGKEMVEGRVLEKRREKEALKKHDKVVESTTNESLKKRNEENNTEEEPIIDRLLFPSRQAKPKFDKQLEKFTEIMKNLEVYIPFTELITHVPAYAKYMKDIVTKKRSIGKMETMAFADTSSAIIQGNSPPKLEDTGSFSIPCTIGDQTIKRALCDLGASVSVMSYARCERLGMGEFKCTITTLQKADRSTKKLLGVLEDVPVRVDVLDITAQCIHSRIFDKMKKVYFWVTMVYGFNKLQERESLWEKLRSYALQCDGSWTVCGDFNSIVAVDERIGGTEVTWAEMAPMRNMMSDCNLFELKMKGSYYTWNNKHEAATRVYSRLDRVIVNDDWLLSFPESVAHFLPEGLFDHCPCIITMADTYVRKKPSFKVPPMFRIVKKLKGLKQKLKELDREQLSDIENLTHVAELSLKYFQEQVMSNPLNPDFCNAEKECAQELIQLKKARDSFLAQKAKEDWAKNGDDNTSFFHARVHPVHKGIVQSGNCLTAEHQNLLTQVVTDDEIKQAMFSIPGTKAPGPDGYSSQFFKDSWAIVGKDICAAVRNMISTGNILKEANNTILTLLPKVDVPDTVTQFRPIACCNTVYKCMVKVVCFRLSSILPDIIHPSQSAFIAGRDIVGNILICQDLIKLYKRNKCSPRLMMKIDLQKAYDSIEWSYLNEMLRGYLESVTLMLSAFSTFSLASGLQMNKDKSNFYCNGVTDSVVQAIENASGMRKAVIPFKYLGVKIIHKRLGVLDCQCLVDRVTKRIQRLGARKLSYAGRVVLISSVLSTLHSYWARVFIIPKTVMKKIESICRAFLWYGKNSCERPNLVSWKQICQPRRKGGLGFKNLHTWNLALIAKYVWWVEKKAAHLWVSWAWKRICQVKNRLKPLLFDATWRDLDQDYSTQMGYTWLADENRLLTQDRLFRMHIIQVNCCFLCGNAEESIDHLFFICPYSQKCKQLLAAWLDCFIPDQGVIQWWIEYRCRSLFMKQCIAAGIASLMYGIWFARNRCRIEHVLPLPAVIIKQVKGSFSMQLKSRRLEHRDWRVHAWVTRLEQSM